MYKCMIVDFIFDYCWMITVGTEWFFWFDFEYAFIIVFYPLIKDHYFSRGTRHFFNHQFFYICIFLLPYEAIARGIYIFSSLYNYCCCVHWYVHGNLAIFQAKGLDLFQNLALTGSNETIISSARGGLIQWFTYVNHKNKVSPSFFLKFKNVKLIDLLCVYIPIIDYRDLLKNKLLPNFELV